MSDERPWDNHLKHLFSLGLTKKLLIVNLLISCLAFGLIGTIVFFSYSNIQTLLTTTIVRDVDENIENAALLKDLSSVFADTALLASIFYKNEALLQDRSTGLVRNTKAIEHKSTYGPLKDSLKDFSTDIHLLFEQCALINGILRQAEKAEQELGTNLSALEKTVSDKKVNQVLDNEDTTFLEQLGVVISGYRETFLHINLLFQKVSAGYAEPVQRQLDASIIGLIDDLSLRLKTLTASEPLIAAYEPVLVDVLEKYKNTALELFDAQEKLSRCLRDVEKSKASVISVMKEIDNNITSSTLKMRHSISGVMQVSSVKILMASALVFIVMAAVSIFFILANIKKPMAAIENGMESIRTGNLDTHIALNRSDEWSKIEKTLNRMTSDLKSSYSQLQEKNVTLETTQKELEEKVSELIAQNEARKRLEEQLLQAQKMEAIGQLAGGIAHDFNNILTAIIGYANLLKAKTQQDDLLQSYVDQVLAASMRAKNLTKNLLVFSRKQVTIAVPVKINDIITNIKKLLAQLIREDIELEAILAEEEMTIMADTGQIEQVLFNLATNARDAMPHGGSLTIETKIVDINSKYADSNIFEQQGKHACISVTDSGTGMDEKTREKIFEPFFTTKEVGKGTGLGLSTAYGIIKQHGGTINVYSEPGHGTTFRLYFPLIESKAAETREQVLPEPEGGSETILLAEDDLDVRVLTKTILTEAGYTVLEAVDGDNAIEVYGRNRDAIQLVLLDVIMPKKNGKEVYNWIKKVNPRAKVLFMSGYSLDLLFKKGVLEEGLDLISKPASPQELRRKIREIIDREGEDGKRVVDEQAEKNAESVSVADSGLENAGVPGETDRHKGTIIIAEDEPHALEYISLILEDNGYTVSACRNAREALEQVNVVSADVVLTDIVMPGMSGWELLDTLHNMDPDLPVIMLTGTLDLGEAVESVKKGAYDFITKPYHPKQLLQSLGKAVRYRRLILFEKEYQQTDPLTGLSTVNRLMPTVEMEWKRAARYSTPLTCMLADIDQLGLINERCGQAGGNAVIAKVALLIKQSIRAVDIAFRRDGGTFVVLAPLTEKNKFMRPALEILQSVSNAEIEGMGDRKVTVSIGIADLSANPMNKAADLIHAATIAMNEAKKNGRNRIEIQTSQA